MGQHVNQQTVMRHRTRRGRLPLNTPMACDDCGTVRTIEKLAELSALALAPVRHLPPGRCEEAEYELACPCCRAAESFQRAVICTECGRRPCRCLLGVATVTTEGILP